ncbi:hypothetical protein JCM10213v2_007001 [Rhodosporidiobolus nylandii]
MVTAAVKGTTIAESNSCEVVEGNQYFPPVSLKREYLSPAKSGLKTHCPWKGEASYYDVHVADDLIPDAAWYYPQPFEKAQHIKDYVAFYPNKVHIHV